MDYEVENGGRSYDGKHPSASLRRFTQKVFELQLTPCVTQMIRSTRTVSAPPPHALLVAMTAHVVAVAVDLLHPTEMAMAMPTIGMLSSPFERHHCSYKL